MLGDDEDIVGEMLGDDVVGAEEGAEEGAADDVGAPVGFAVGLREKIIKRGS